MRRRVKEPTVVPGVTEVQVPPGVIFAYSRPHAVAGQSWPTTCRNCCEPQFSAGTYLMGANGSTTPSLPGAGAAAAKLGAHG